MGCLFGVGQMVARGSFGLGAFLASILLRGLSYVFLTVIGPLFLGSVREIMLRIIRATNDERSPLSRWHIGSRNAYAVLSGVVWVAAYLVLNLLWHLLSWMVGFIANQFPSPLAIWLPPILILFALFVVGAIVGAQVHRYENGRV